MNVQSGQHQGERALSRISLLVVEDDPFTLQQLARALAREVREVVTASDGEQGVAAFRQHRPDLVLTDLNMPVLDGLEMAARIKALSPDTPVIAATAHNDERSLHKAIEVGMDGYVSKPVDLAALRPVLLKCAGQALSRRQDAEQRQLFGYLLDINPHMIVSASGGRPDYANRTFLQFLGVGSLEELMGGAGRARGEINVDGKAFALDDFSWIDEIAARADSRARACFPGPDEACGLGITFWINASKFPELDRTIATLTDITPLERERARLLHRATTDSLTGVANRFRLDESIAVEFARFRRYKTPLSLIMFDIDHFKHVNDTRGHNIGDQVLSGLAQLVSGAVRGTDALGRWGGEEFLVLAPLTPLEEAQDLAERLRSTVEGAVFPGGLSVTCSFGVAQVTEDDDAQSLLDRVDSALYKAKENGRNRVETA